MRFQWYIVDRDEGTVQGTNDVEEIQHLLEDERYVVMTAQHGKFFCGSTEEQEVDLFTDEDSEDEDDEFEVEIDEEELEDVESEDDIPGTEPDDEDDKEAEGGDPRDTW